jgi:hypothetical protein
VYLLVWTLENSKSDPDPGFLQITSDEPLTLSLSHGIIIIFNIGNGTPLLQTLVTRKRKSDDHHGYS